jgi:hypothetical protein
MVVGTDYRPTTMMSHRHSLQADGHDEASARTSIGTG